jgi:prohibitin 2
MNRQEAFRRLANQLKTAGGGGGPLPGGPKGLFAGSGLLIALVAGGFALNASLFNGTISPQLYIQFRSLRIIQVDGGHRAIKYTR